MPRAARSDYVVLSDRNSENKLGLRPLTDDQGKLLYSWRLAPPLAPSLPPEDVSYGQFSMDQEFVWSVSDWSQGALKFYHNPRQPNFYAIADKAWASTPNEVSLGIEPIPVCFGIPNGGAELGATTNWTASGVTLTAVTTAPFAGLYHFQMASTSTNDYINHSLENVSRWRANAISVTAKVRGDEAGGQVRVQIVESGGTSTPTTSGTAVTLTTSYQSINAGVNLQSDTSGVQIRIQCSADGGSDRTVYVDEVQAHATNSSTEGQSANHLRMVVTTQGLHCVTATALYMFSETSDYWELRYSAGTAITGAEVFDNQIFLGLGESTAYYYSDVADSTTWTAHDGSGTQDNANFFIKTLNVSGNWVLAKTLNDDDVHLAVDPTASAGWGAAIEVGKDDHVIRNVFNIGGTIAVGKEDGFYRYQGFQGNRFTNLKEDAESSQDARNFSRGVMYNGWFFTIQSEVGLVRFQDDPSTARAAWQNLNPLLQSPGFSEFGGKVTALGTDGASLFLLVEDLSSASITKSSWLFGLTEFEDGSWAVHTLTSLTMSDAVDMAVFKPSGATNNFLFLNGEVTTSEAFSYRLQLPDRTDIPRLATNPAVALSGTLITSFWDGGRPTVNKSFNKFTLQSEKLDGSKTVAVAYQIDNDTDWTAINSTNATFTGSPIGTIQFESGVVGKRVRFRFTLTSDDSEISPIIKGFGLHLSWRPDRLKNWTVVAAVEDGLHRMTGVPNALPARRMLSQLDNLRQSRSPLRFEDIDGTEWRASIFDMAETMVRVRENRAGVPQYQRGVQIELVEVIGLTGWGSWFWNEFHWQ